MSDRALNLPMVMGKTIASIYTTATTMDLTFEDGSILQVEICHHADGATLETSLVGGAHADGLRMERDG